MPKKAAHHAEAIAFSGAWPGNGAAVRWWAVVGLARRLCAHGRNLSSGKFASHLGVPQDDGHGSDERKHRGASHTSGTHDRAVVSNPGFRLADQFDMRSDRTA
ncbi:hypothetical protein GCM10017687_63380 [Streptomyces echinatus]